LEPIAIAPPPSPVRRFLWARFTGQVALNAVLYALLIEVVERTGSNLGSTVLVASFVGPSILLGVPGGMLADALPRRPTLVGALLLRGAIVLALAFWIHDMVLLYVLVIALAAVGQVYAPAESAMITELAPAGTLARANTWSSFVLIMSQALGGVALAPVVFKLFGARAVFGIAVGLFLLAAWQMTRVRVPARVARVELSPAETLRPAVWRLVRGWQVIRNDRLIFGALVRLTALGTVLKVLIAVSPTLASDVLQIAAANTVYVMAPAAIGSAIGLVLVLPLTRFLSPHVVGRLAFLLFAAGVLALALAEPIAEWLEARTVFRLASVEEVTRVPTLVSVVMLIAVFLGVAFTLAGVAIRTLVNERAPLGLQGRVFATQLTLADAISLLPLIAAGMLVDHIGVNPVLLAMGLLCLVSEAILIRRGGWLATAY